jgi:hypothetical protein
VKAHAAPPSARTFLVLCALLLLPLCLLGFGADNDTYTMLDAGRSTWHLHWPDTSRNPGYWVFEAIVYVLDRLGGSLATNLATLAVGVVVLWRFLVIASRLGVRFPLLLCATLAVTPVFAIACTSTIDYVWSLLGLVLSAELLIADLLALAVLAAAFAFAVRGANGVLIAGAILAAIVVSDRRRAPRLLAVGLAAALLGGIPYIESYRLAHNTLVFTHALAPDWSIPQRAGRFAYKSLYLFGPIATAILLGSILLGCPISIAVSSRLRWGPTESTPPSPYRQRATPIFLGMLLTNLLLFLIYPIEISYLIPAAFFALLLLGATLLARSRTVAATFFLAVFSLNILTPQLAAPDPSISARIRPSLQPGLLVEDVRHREALRLCTDYACFYAVAHPNGPPLRYFGPKPPLSKPLK